jgi:hypothetical protein
MPQVGVIFSIVINYKEQQMQNIEMKQEGNILTIKIDISKRGGTSKSGKSTSVASTGGNVAITEGSEVKIGINCYVPVGK